MAGAEALGSPGESLHAPTSGASRTQHQPRRSPDAPRNRTRSGCHGSVSTEHSGECGEPEERPEPWVVARRSEQPYEPSGAKQASGRVARPTCGKPPPRRPQCPVSVRPCDTAAPEECDAAPPARSVVYALSAGTTVKLRPVGPANASVVGWWERGTLFRIIGQPHRLLAPRGMSAK